MTVTVDITDPKVVRAYAHPLRIRILGLLDNRVASPSEIATELDTPLPNTAYHVRQLAALGFIKLVGRKVRGGAVEHRYTATVRPFVSDDVHARLPDIVKRAIAGGWVEQTIEHMVDAVDGGGFARERSHCSRTAGRLDAQAWDEIADLLGDALKQVQRVIEQSEKRVAKDPESEAPTATTVLALFEGPNPAIGDRQPGPKAARRTAAKSPPRKAKRSR